jgi:hypothetical protein
MFQNFNENFDDDTSEVKESLNEINILPKFKTHKNDLSAFELSTNSSKNTLSGDDMISNISFYSQEVLQIKPNLEVENDFNLNNQSVDRFSIIDIMSSTAKDQHSISRYLYTYLVTFRILLQY